jgi:hypothetical protein
VCLVALDFFADWVRTEVADVEPSSWSLAHVSDCPRLRVSRTMFLWAFFALFLKLPSTASFSLRSACFCLTALVSKAFLAVILASCLLRSDDLLAKEATDRSSSAVSDVVGDVGVAGVLGDCLVPTR